MSNQLSFEYKGNLHGFECFKYFLLIPLNFILEILKKY